MADAWTIEEVGALLDLARTHEPGFHAALAFLFYTGARRGEVLGLKWEDVDFDRGRIHIRRAVVRSEATTPKSGRSRYVAMAPDLGSLRTPGGSTLSRSRSDSERSDQRSGRIQLQRR